MRNRLILAFVTLLLMMSTSAYMSVVYFDRTAAELQMFVQDQSRRTILAQRASQQAQMAANQLLLLLLTEDREERKPLYRDMDKALSMSDAALRTLSKEQDYADVSKLIEMRSQFGGQFQETVELIEFDGLAAAKRHFNESTFPILNALLVETERISIGQQDSMFASEAQLRSRAESVKLIIILIELTLVMLSFIFAFKIASSFGRQIDDSIESADRIASGDFEAQTSKKASTPEMRRLYDALNRMRQSILGRELYIKRVAYEDSVTKLGNRNKFFDTLQDRVKTHSGAIVLLDINRFSQINSALGHAIGDIVLKEVGARLAAQVSTNDEIARLEGNKFAVLLSSLATLPELETALCGLRAAVTEPLYIKDQRLDIDLSTGACRFPETSQDLDTIIRSAESALSIAKRKKEHFHIATSAVEADDDIHLSLLGELRSALNEEQFRLYYQPKFDLKTKELKSVEALVRWQHPTQGQVRPDLFIPFAEKTGFIKEITPWVIYQALRDASQWFAKGQYFSVSVNVSAIDLTNPDLIPIINQALKTYPIPAEKLCLEVTESALMDDPKTSFERLKALSELGIRLSMDDYGTGQASLAYVRDLPVDELKIDRSFITDIDSNTKNAAIVSSTLFLCRELGISVVAEGVETDKELLWLQQHNCNLVQGYRISRPIPLAELLDWQPDEKLCSLGD